MMQRTVTPAQLDTETLRLTLAKTKEKYWPGDIPSHLHKIVDMMESELKSRSADRSLSMAFFVRYSTAKYEGENTEEFGSEQEVVAFLNKHASNPDFTFDVIEGRRVVFEPVSVATQYRKK